ncbi:precorrin-3B C(17)-methyltransferase [Acidithrix sp. C25]|uniref:precorrin-3B C(17)-methyltransferase n=1 Tax=Acidithrix sp. C25 TaxID=1671482 RepID=UPI00191B90A5|nr:precorrin-3B C(17)-methyltransferase [Acidithrix sp. C25]CAG4930282.1 unnamed protein product [Acidithrix sp. C25]
MSRFVFTLKDADLDLIARRIPNSRLLTFNHESLAENWESKNELILIMALGAAIRIIAPLITTKYKDPKVIVIDSNGENVIPILGAHLGANQSAQEIAQLLAARPIITTSSDLSQSLAIDAFRGFRAIGQVAGFITSTSRGERFKVLNPANHWLPPMLRSKAMDDSRSQLNEVLISNKKSQIEQFLHQDDSTLRVVLIPKNLVLGVGASSDASSGDSRLLLDEVLGIFDITPEALALVATIDKRANHPAICGLDLPIASFSPSELDKITTPNGNELVRSFVGTTSVAEASALLSSKANQLLIEKQKGPKVTIAIAEALREGHLSICGLGPGSMDLVTPKTIRALLDADVVIGFDGYINQIEHLLNPSQLILSSPIGQETKRAQESLSHLRMGDNVALVASGDPGIYALATLVLELKNELPLEDRQSSSISVLPGVTAGLSAASLLGAPLGHDHCYISLSDLMTPWKIIRKRIEAAAEADFGIVFYNPRSKERNWQLNEALTIIAASRPGTTPIGIVKDAYRPNQEVIVTTLDEIDTDIVTMTTTVVVGSSTTFIVDGLMTTPRGYLSK